MAVFFSCIWIVWLLFICCLTEQIHEIDIYRITSLTGTAGPTITGAEWLAIQEINNNSNLLPNYKFNFHVYDNSNELNDALNDLLTILHEQSNTCPTDDNSTNISTHFFPVLLGVQRSSISTLIASVAGVNNMGLISATSTSVALSNANTYPYFYRTIASDALQSKGLIFLCDKFNWTRIVVVYGNDAYGLHLSVGIQEIGKLHGIDVSSVAIEEDTDLTYVYAAKQVKTLDKYIIILVLGSVSVANLFHIFDTEGLLGYPYFYLGVDSWIDSTGVTQSLGNKTTGFIGTLPWNINTINLQEYGEDIIDVVNTAAIKTNNLLNSWAYRYKNGDAYNLRLETPRGYVVYAYDAMYSVAYAIEAIEKKYGLNSMVNMLENNSTGQVIKILNEFILNVNFIGASGHVTFDSNGDRQNGFFSFGHISNDGNVQYMGYFLENKELVNATGIDSIHSYINMDKIEWPSYFTEKGIIPQSDIIIYKQILIINKSLFTIMCICCSMAICIVTCAIIFTIYHRKNTIIKRGSWRINIVMCIGCILSFIAAIFFGIDERIISIKNSMNILCEIRLFLVVIAFTVAVMPLFFKTWRLVQIFNDMTQVKKISDTQLFLYIFICVIIDTLLLTIFMLIEPYQRVYNNGSKYQIDELQYTQETYGVCVFSDRNNSDVIFYFYVILFLWKFGQLLFGIYCALNVARIHGNPYANKNVLARFLKFDETGSQLGSIGLTVIILCISVLCIAFIPNDSSSGKYAIISIAILIVGIIIFMLNLLPRIIGVCKKDDLKYQQSVEQQFKEILKKKIFKIQTQLKSNSSIIVGTSSVNSDDDNNDNNNNKTASSAVNELAAYVQNSQ